VGGDPYDGSPYAYSPKRMEPLGMLDEALKHGQCAVSELREKETFVS
jgi:hypothetical protein